jgi:hypothetical protein
MFALVPNLLTRCHLAQAKIDPAGTDVGTVNSIMGMIFTLTAFLGSFNTMTVQPVVGGEREVFYRERAASMYATGPFALATSLVEVPYLMAQSLLMVLIIYWAVGFQTTGWQWWYFYLTYTLSLTLFTFFGQVRQGCACLLHGRCAKAARRAWQRRAVMLGALRMHVLVCKRSGELHRYPALLRP